MKDRQSIKGSIMLSTRDYFAEILPWQGANCIRLHHVPSGAELLRTPGRPEDYTEKNPFLYGMPLLFWPNRIQTGRFIYEGREYRFPVNEKSTGCHLHGTLHQTLFQVEATSKNRGVFSYSASEERPYHGFPHAFTLEVEYLLTDDGLQQTVTMKNNSNCVMPFALAFHTTFRIPFLPDSESEHISILVPNDGEYQRDKDFLPTGKLITEKRELIDLNEGSFVPGHNKISALLKRQEGGKVLLTDRYTGLQVAYCVDEKYRCWMLFNGGAKDLVCIEPQTCISNAPYASLPDTERGLLLIEPSESIVLKTLLYVAGYTKSKG